MTNTTRTTRYDAPNPIGIGINEEALHPGSGLRLASVSAAITQLSGANRISQLFDGNTGDLGSLPNSGHTLAGQGTWVSILGSRAMRQNRLPVPMTPTIMYATLPLDSLAPSRFKFRVSGLDQFGSRIVETTPWIVDQGWSLSSYVVVLNLSRVFSLVDNIEYQHDGRANAAFTYIKMGWHCAIDPVRLETGTPDWGVGASTARFLDTEYNWGIGSPLRLAPFNTVNPYRFSELVAASGVLLREDQTPAVINTPITFPIYGSAQKASAVLTISGAVANNETVTLGARVYTWKTTLTGAANEVLIGGSTAASLANIAAAINRTAGEGTTYGLGTVAHQQLDSIVTGATTVQFVAKSSSMVGFFIASTETMANGAFAAATLSEGTPAVGVVLGQSLAGWEGCAHKIGFRSSDDWTTKLSGFELGGSSINPAGVTTAFRDQILFNFTVRTSLGTARDKSGTSGYLS